MRIKLNNVNFLGVALVVVYVTTVILGGFLWGGYSHVEQSISELSAVFSPIQLVMIAGFGLYNVLLATFSYLYWKKSGHLALRISAATLFCISLLGIAMLIFPQDKIGGAVTFSGQIHLVAAGLTSLATLVAVISAIFGFRSTGNRRAMVDSVVFATLILITGPLTAFATTNMPHYFGLLERLTIGSFLAWVVLMAIALRTPKVQ